MIFVIDIILLFRRQFTVLERSRSIKPLFILITFCFRKCTCMGTSYFLAMCPNFFSRCEVHDRTNLGVTTGVIRGFCQKRESTTIRDDCPHEWVYGPEYLQLLLMVTDLILTTCSVVVIVTTKVSFVSPFNGI